MKTDIAKLLSLVIILVSYIVILGWFTGSEVLKQVLSQWSAMQFSTALSFFCSGIILYAVASSHSRNRSSIAEILLPTSILVILLLMASIFTSIVLGVRISMEEVFIQTQGGDIFTERGAGHSIGEIIGFVLVAITGMNAMLRSQGRTVRLRILACMILGIGAVTYAGFHLGDHGFYQSFGLHYSSMEEHTSILFILISFGMLLSSFSSKKKRLKKQKR